MKNSLQTCRPLTVGLCRPLKELERAATVVGVQLRVLQFNLAQPPQPTSRAALASGDHVVCTANAGLATTPTVHVPFLREWRKNDAPSYQRPHQPRSASKELTILRAKGTMSLKASGPLRKLWPLSSCTISWNLIKTSWCRTMTLLPTAWRALALHWNASGPRRREALMPRPTAVLENVMHVICCCDVHGTA